MANSEAEPRVSRYVWLGEGRVASIKRWYTLFSTCRLSRNSAREALESHPSRADFDKVRIKKFLRETR